LSLCLVLAGPARSGEEAGRALMAAAGCFACHRVAGVGGNAAPDLSYVGFRRSKAWLDLWLRDPHAWKADTRMPNFRLKPGARDAIVDYLASLKGAGDPPWRGAGERRGRLIYDRAGCVACHGPKGTGGQPNNNVPGGAIPALAKAGEGYTLEELERVIRDGERADKADPGGPEPLVSMPAWGKVLSTDDIEAVSRYVLSFSSGAVSEAW
jgi:mono/diheme cytochrome c family protein